MNILITAATLIESQVIIDELNLKQISSTVYYSDKYKTKLLISGVGIPSMFYSLLSIENIEEYELIINIGIVGAFDNSIKIGEVFNITTDYFGDTGFFDENNNFKNLYELSFNKQFHSIFKNNKLVNDSSYPKYFDKICTASSVTVNIPENNSYKNTMLESMEGAAFMFILKQKSLNFIQLRGVSNIIGITKKKDWQFTEPIKNYSKPIIDFITNKQ